MDSIMYTASILFFAVMIAILTADSTAISLDPYENRIVAIESRWWRLSKRERELRWMKNGEDENSRWMAKGDDGKWYPYIVEDNTVTENPQ
jgi:hypothetical protein